MASSIEIVGNDAVHWDGVRFGLSPTLSDKAERLVVRGEVNVPALLDCLTDPQRFVTAHVVLTRISDLAYETFPTWNGLNVDLRASGEVLIDQRQRHALALRWKRFYRTSPRPSSLPEPQ